MAWTTVEHFGEQVRSGKYGHHLTRELYALPNKTQSSVEPRWMVSDERWAAEAWLYEDEDHIRLSDAFCTLQREAALENFDLNISFFAEIEPDAFESALTEMLRKNKALRHVTDLREFDMDEGVYVMVLDRYRQAYIGQSADIRARIKRHWTGVKAFDRLMCGETHESVLSIDSFRALDTTRIYAARTTRGDALESRLVRTFPEDYLLNRIAGGKPGEARVMFLGAETKRRQLITHPSSRLLGS